MAGEIQAQHVTGATLYAVFLDANGGVWNGAAFDPTPTSGEWTTYDIAMTEDSTTGYYRGDMPVVAEALYSYRVHKQLAGSPASTDPAVWTGEIDTSGVEIGQDSIDDIVAGLIGQGAYVSAPNQTPATGSLGVFVRATTWVMPAISVGTIPDDRDSLWFTIKEFVEQDDSEAVIQITDDGLVVLNGAEAGVALDGSFAYDEVEDELTPRAEIGATSLVSPKALYHWDVKWSKDGESYQVAAGTMGVTWPVTHSN